MRALWILILALLTAAAAAFVVTAKPWAPRAQASADTSSEPTPAPKAKPAPTPAPKSAEPVNFEQDLKNAVKTAANSVTPKPVAAIGEGTSIDLPTNTEYPRDKVIPAKAKQIAPGKMLIDGQYEVTGAGTKADPYIVPFDVLVSAADTFDPRKGLSRLPERVTFLHEKYVKLTGYIAFPISSSDPKEALVMLNQWDGCCIGVPPTAYDAIEIKLAKPATGDDRFVTHGSITGLFKVSPYTDGGWLLGLYLMEDGVLKGDDADPAIKRRRENQ